MAAAMSYDPPSYVVAKAWGDVKLTATTYVVNRRGEIVKRYVGAPISPSFTC